jgi:catechol O-methyltransferase
MPIRLALLMRATVELRLMTWQRSAPFLRWSFWRMVVGQHNLPVTGQIGDGREAAVADYVEANSRQGDIDDVLSAIDRFAYTKSFLVNIGDEKGELLDAAVRRADPSLVLELGTYCGYSALRIARAAPLARVYSIELAAANAGNARRIWAHAGVVDRITCVVGTLGDGGATLDALANIHGFRSGSVDFVFIDHDKDAYLSDLRSVLDRGWLHHGSIVMADNVKIPGAPEYRTYMREQQAKHWRSIEHRTHGEYQSLMPDIVVESEYLSR